MWQPITKRRRDFLTDALLLLLLFGAYIPAGFMPTAMPTAGTPLLLECARSTYGDYDSAEPPPLSSDSRSSSLGDL